MESRTDTPTTAQEAVKTVSLYQKTKKIYPRAVHGFFSNWRWALVWITQIVFYGACWLPWATEAGTRQAILFDIADEKLYLFDMVLWPQDALLLAIVLILAAGRGERFLTSGGNTHKLREKSAVAV